ncbi:MAG: ribosomal protein S18-alanine N-acetyltransferase [Acidobacteriota bacterium]
MRTALEKRERLTMVPMDRQHLEQVLAIEEQVFSRPWTAAAFVQEMRNNPFARTFVGLGGGGPGPGRAVWGYVCLWTILSDLHINNIAVCPARQRRGIGQALLLFALDFGAREGCERALLEVRPSNFPAKKLYRKLGFHRVGRRPRYYTDNGEDALLMQCQLEGRAGNP